MASLSRLFFASLSKGRVKRRTLLAGWICSILLLQASAASTVDCERGEPVTAGLGDGVTLHSCSWEKTPGQFVRSGPLRLVRNGIPILELQTDQNGKLQGRFNSWDDNGNIQQSGYYVDGLKHGEWQITGSDGERLFLQYRQGILVGL